MNIDPEEMSIKGAAAEILKPVDDLLATEADELKKADEIIDGTETMAKKMIVPAKLADGSDER